MKGRVYTCASCGRVKYKYDFETNADECIICGGKMYSEMRPSEKREWLRRINKR